MGQLGVAVGLYGAVGGHCEALCCNGALGGRWGSLWGTIGCLGLAVGQWWGSTGHLCVTVGQLGVAVGHCGAAGDRYGLLWVTCGSPAPQEGGVPFDTEPPAEAQPVPGGGDPPFPFPPFSHPPPAMPPKCGAGVGRALRLWRRGLWGAGAEGDGGRAAGRALWQRHPPRPRRPLPVSGALWGGPYGAPGG